VAQFLYINNMKHPFSVKGNIEIERNGECFLNVKRIMLLKLIKEKGSINAASKELKMSYQQAWHFIKKMNELSPIPLVVHRRGGSNGGGADLTKFGEKAIIEFEKLMEQNIAYREELSVKLWLCSF
jgi:molybdate transport system regulatory protein